MTSQTTPLIDVAFEYVPVINFSMQQNHVPVARKLFIRNISDTDLQEITVAITAEPDFAHQHTDAIPILQAGQGFELTPDIKLSVKYLSELTERISGIFQLRITAGQQEIFNKTYNVGILAYDQWSGIAIMPEILSAFVTPNHPGIPKIIKRASEILSRWTGNPSFDEYQSKNPDRVKKQMAAIYEAIAEREIVYCSAPASFEETGQRIRIIDTIFDQQIANCLDLSLLYASCLEAVGINSLLVITKGHAFAGAWLVGETFSDPINDDLSLITKRIADGINDIAVVEATCMNAGHKASFDDAIRAAINHMNNDKDFILFVDVKRSRFGGVRPLPLRIKTAEGWEVVEDSPQKRTNDAPEEIVAGRKVEHVEEIATTRQQVWERKLLDLTLRNNLLNLRISKNTVQLISVNLDKLEDRISNGEEFQVLAKPADWDNPLRSAGVYQSLNSTDPITDLVKQELSQNRLRSYLSPVDLANSLTNLYRASRLSLEENGANTLYMAIGLLKWYESPLSERPHFAPIILLPIEIIRKTIHKGYIIRSREEDAIMNITLLEMLRQDFGIVIGGLETLVRDERGVDVKHVFNVIRQSIMSQSRWDVEEQAILGIFSFSKFVMWNDIHANADKLARNKIVDSLISGKIKWPATHSLPGDVAFDKRYHPSDIALPISADASQLEAICAAGDDNSFVLHGPPGTGKSQTITNIIANSLYKGKKVLFVAEKMAALSVVKSRLEAIGLGPFCLELHSNKTRKSSVLEQLKKTIEVVKTSPPQQFRHDADRLHTLRTELNEYVEALHKKYDFGLSLYDIFTAYTSVMSAPDKVTFDDRSISALTPQQLNSWDDIAAEVQAMGSICGHPHGHPLESIQTRHYTQSVKNEARELLTRYITDLKEYEASVTALTKKLNLQIPLDSKKQFIQLQLVCDLLASLPDTPPSLMSADSLDKTLAKIAELIPHGRKRDELQTALLSGYDKSILSLNATGTLAEWNNAAQKWFLPKWLKQRAIKNTLRQLSLKKDIGGVDISTLMQDIIACQKEKDIVDRSGAQLSTVLGWLWQGGNCDWDALTHICDRLQRLNTELLTLLESPRKAKEWRTAMSHDLSEGRQAFHAVYGKYFTGYSTIFFSIARQENKLHELLGIDFNNLAPLTTDRIANCSLHAEKCLKNIEQLRDWVNWLLVKDKAITAGLTPLITPYERGQLDSHEVVCSYKKGILRSCAEYIFSKEPALRTFNGKLFEEKINRFREISAQFEQLTKEELFAKLASRLPVSVQEAAQSSELGILMRAIKNNGRAMSIRRLFDSISNLLPRLTPCMLMSPISVAQYFDASNAKFDLVIFDEASQMPTCDAVGAIARGNNVIIVGDPNQMPPTSFFSTNQVDGDDEREDLESILDDCLALSMPQKHLLWHYRSKHESLIAFSNSKYYENRLLTFPSPDDITSKVSYVHIPGHYDRSATRQNRFEAQAIVDDIITRLADPVLSRRSIGVVTFSAAQQTLVNDLLDEALKSNPALEAAAYGSPEPLFIKNLENVQGDERDVILFSVGYGPDKDGRVSLNFGPLNREGGWRRLNVAVSRARYEMKVFSTLRAAQIDITRTASEGVAGLRAFLEYAEKGKAVLGYRNPVMLAKAPELVQLIADEVKAQGYDAHTNIGCSGYRIDIGIVDAKEPARYKLAVLCDGINYLEARTARDREIVQYKTLRQLGWSVHRIWSADWWEDPRKVVDGIIKAIDTAEQAPPEKDIPSNTPAPQTIETRAEPVLNSAPLVVQPLALAPPVNDTALVYRVCQLEPVTTASSDDFLRQSSRQKIGDQINDVLRTEAPITRDLLCRRILAAWGIARAGARISSHFDTMFDLLQLRKTTHGSKTIFWSPFQMPHYYDEYRVPAKETEKRDAEDLPPEEIANAIHYLLINQVSLPREELIRETARIFGFARIGTNVESAIATGLSCAIERGYAVEENSRVVLKG